jgi:hypothetical protein
VQESSRADEMRDILLAEIANLNPSIFVSKWILERIPHVFGGDQLRYNEWRKHLAEKIDVDPCAIALTGSASVGISLNPNKSFRGFDERSDIDVAVISSYHFEIAWRFIRNMGFSNVRKISNEVVSSRARRENP